MGEVVWALMISSCWMASECDVPNVSREENLFVSRSDCEFWKSRFIWNYQHANPGQWVIRNQCMTLADWDQHRKENTK